MNQNEGQNFNFHISQILDYISNTNPIYCIESGHYEFILQGFIFKFFDNDRNKNKLLAYIYIQLHRYQDAIDCLEKNQCQIYLVNYCLIGFCYYKMKKYKKALGIFQQLQDSFQWSLKLIQYLMSYENKTIFQEKIEYLQFQEPLYYQLVLQLHCEILQQQLEQLPNQKFSEENINLLLSSMNEDQKQNVKNIEIYHCQFQFLYRLDCNQNQQTLSNLVRFMIEKNKKFAKGYSNLYQLLIHQNCYQEAYNLNEYLLQCDESSTKYKALAKLHYDVEEYEQAIQYLQIALTLNQFDNEIYNQLIQIHIKINQYQNAYKIMENYIKLENENIVFIMSYGINSFNLVNNFINKYEYHKAYYILHLADQQESKLMSKIKLLYQILIYPSSLSEISIPDLINRLPYQTTAEYCEKVLFQAHYMLKNLNFQGAQARYHYLQTPFQNLKDQQSLNITQSVLEKLKSQQQLNSVDIHNQICKYIIDYTDQSSQYVVQRFMNSMSYLICSFINTQSDTIFIEWFNQQNDSLISFQNQQSIPNQYTLLLIIKNTIEKLYNYQNISKDTYMQKLSRTKQDFMMLFKDCNQFYHQIKLFFTTYEKQLLEIINSMQFEYVYLKLEISNLLNYYFFHDPISKLSLVQFIKLVGYFTEFRIQDSGIETIQQFLQFCFIKQNIQGYYETVIQFNK